MKNVRWACIFTNLIYTFILYFLYLPSEYSVLYMYTFSLYAFTFIRYAYFA